MSRTGSVKFQYVFTQTNSIRTDVFQKNHSLTMFVCVFSIKYIK